MNHFDVSWHKWSIGHETINFRGERLRSYTVKDRLEGLAEPSSSTCRIGLYFCFCNCFKFVDVILLYKEITWWSYEVEILKHSTIC